MPFSVSNPRLVLRFPSPDKSYTGVKTINKRVIRDDVTKIMVVEGREEKCPRFKQIRYLAFFNIAANGPNGARALTRKILGNEEYCMQIDAHTTFVPSWDEIAKTEWKNARNEFAIISTAPANLAEMSDYESWTGAKNGQVPRQCLVRFADNEIPVRYTRITLNKIVRPRRSSHDGNENHTIKLHL